MNQTQTIFGYARVSSKEQFEDRQLLAMAEFAIQEKNLYIDKQSGKDFRRPAYQIMIDKLKPGDLLVIKSIDRLGRNYSEIIEQWRLITREINADIVVLDMPLLDTRSNKDLLGTLISDLVLQLLSFVAQNERENIQQRQKEGIAAARIRGVKFGRPTKINSIEESAEVVQLWIHGRLSIEQVSDMLGVSIRTLYRWKSLYRRRISNATTAALVAVSQED